MAGPDINTSGFLWHIVPAFLGRVANPQKTGLYVALDMRMNHWQNNREFARRIPLAHCFFMRGVRTFWMTTEEWISPIYKNFPWNEMDNISNHDSCWRDAVTDKIFRLYMTNANHLIDEVKANTKRRKLAPCDLHSYMNIHNMYLVDVELDRVLNADGYARNQIKSASNLQHLG